VNVRRYLSGEDRHVGTARTTYPCVVGHRIVELTEEQRAAAEWRALPTEEKIAHLLERIETLELRLKELHNR